jgi:uncharacterized membrane protein
VVIGLVKFAETMLREVTSLSIQTIAGLLADTCKVISLLIAVWNKWYKRNLQIKSSNYVGFKSID